MRQAQTRMSLSQALDMPVRKPVRTGVRKLPSTDRQTIMPVPNDRQTIMPVDQQAGYDLQDTVSPQLRDAGTVNMTRSSLMPANAGTDRFAEAETGIESQKQQLRDAGTVGMTRSSLMPGNADADRLNRLEKSRGRNTAYSGPLDQRQMTRMKYLQNRGRR